MEEKGHKGDSSFLWFSTLAINLASLSAGTAFAWSSPSIPRLNGNMDPSRNPLPTPLTQSEESMIASLIAIGAIFSPFVSAQLSDKIGRKKTLIVSLTPMLVSYLLISIANNVWYFYIARLLCGVCVGALFAVTPNYVAELSQSHNRGALSTLMVVNITFGNLLIYTVGPFLTIQMAAFICIIPPICCILIVMIYVPDSPYYLVAQNNEAAALASLIKLRKTECVQTELLEITQSVQESFMGKSSIFDLFKNHSSAKGIKITLGLVIFQQFCGINAILFYLQTIFDATGSQMAPELSSIIIAIVQFTAAFITPFLIDRLGRRFLLFVSGLGTFVSLISIGVFFYLKNLDLDCIESISWLPIASLIGFIFTYSVGFGPIPFTMLGEIFEPKFKAAASTLTVSFCFVLTFCTTMFFPYMLALFGTPASFWFFAIFCGVSLAFIQFFVPETKGKSFAEIQQIMKE